MRRNRKTNNPFAQWATLMSAVSFSVMSLWTCLAQHAQAHVRVYGRAHQRVLPILCMCVSFNVYIVYIVCGWWLRLCIYTAKACVCQHEFVCAYVCVCLCVSLCVHHWINVCAFFWDWDQFTALYMPTIAIVDCHCNCHTISSHKLTW